MKPLLDERLKNQGFNVCKKRFWLKLENGILYRLGTTKFGIECEACPLFENLEVTAYNRSLMGSMHAIPYEVQMASPIMQYGAFDERTEEYINMVYNDYILPYFNAINSIETSLDYLRRPFPYGSNAYKRVLSDSQLPIKYTHIGFPSAITAHLIYLKRYDELEKHLLCCMVSNYENYAQSFAKGLWIPYGSPPDYEQIYNNAVDYAKRELSPTCRGPFSPGRILRMLSDGDERGMLEILEAYRLDNVEQLMKIWPKRQPLPEWVTTPYL